MYKFVMTHEIFPGKLPDVKKYIQGNYDKMREKNPDLKVPGDPEYTGPVRQYITMYGSAYQFVYEQDFEELPDSGQAYAEMSHEMLQYIVPGHTVIQLLKQLEFNA